MTQRTPYDHTLAEINDLTAAINRIANGPTPGDVTAGILTARANLAIASALLAVAIRSTQPDRSAQ